MGYAVRVEAARVAPMPESAAAQGSVTAAGVREAVVAVVPWHISHAIIQPASQSLRHSYQLDARSTYVYPQAVEEVSMPGSNQADADAVFDAAATKVQAVLRGSSARKKSATKKADGEVSWRTDGGLGVVGWDGRCGWRQHGWSQCPSRRRRKVR